MSEVLDELNAHLEFLREEPVEELEEAREILEDVRDKSRRNMKALYTAAAGSVAGTFSSNNIIDHFYSYQELQEDLGVSEPELNLAIIGIGMVTAFGLAYIGNQYLERKIISEQVLDYIDEDEKETYRELKAKEGLKAAEYISEEI